MSVFGGNSSIEKYRANPYIERFEGKFFLKGV